MRDRSQKAVRAQYLWLADMLVRELSSLSPVLLEEVRQAREARDRLAARGPDAGAALTDLFWAPFLGRVQRLVADDLNGEAARLGVRGGPTLSHLTRSLRRGWWPRRVQLIRDVVRGIYPIRQEWVRAHLRGGHRVLGHCRRYPDPEKCVIPPELLTPDGQRLYTALPPPGASKRPRP